jgi:3-oxoacyl-[acyl-carrier protein] reductase
LEAAAKELHERYGTTTQTAPFDVSDPTAVSAAFRLLHQEFKHLDILIANAGVLEDALVGMIPDDLPRRMLEVNTLGSIYTLQAAARLMRRQHAGAIVLMSSIIGIHGNAGQVAYAASKAAIVGITRSAAKELGPLGIRVNAVAPGLIKTAMTAHLSADTIARRIEDIALGRIGDTGEVADVIAFLVSDAARYVTGQVLGVDGGMII